MKKQEEQYGGKIHSGGNLKRLSMLLKTRVHLINPLSRKNQYYVIKSKKVSILLL